MRRIRPPSRPRRRAGWLTGAALALTLVAACGGDPPAGDALDGSSWEMTWVWNGELASADPTVMVTSTFAHGEVGGSDGCNRYTLRYAVEGSAVSFDDLIITGAACGPVDRVAQADAFIAAVQSASAFSVTDDSLELLDVAGRVVVRYRPAHSLPLMGIAWILDGYAGGTGGLTTPLDGSQITVSFGRDGALQGVAGCNQYGATYETDGERLLIGPIAHTEMACQEPPGVMDQESDYLTALSRATEYRTTLTNLELLDADGTVMAAYRFGGRARS